MRTKQPGQPRHLLAPDRVPLVRHCRRALLALPERFLDLADFGPLQPSNFEGELLERCAGDGERGQELAVAVALQDLRGNGRRPKLESRTDAGLDRRVEMGVGPDGARDLADVDHVTRALHTHAVPLELGVPECELQAERHRLGVHAVRPTDHDRTAMRLGLGADRLSQRGEVSQDEIARLTHLDRLCRVEHVRRGQPEV